MAISISQKQLDVNSMRPGRPIIQVAVNYAAAGDTGTSGAYTFTTPFKKAPDVLGIAVVGNIASALGAAAITALSATQITLMCDKGTAAAAVAYITLQGEI